jgi:hypothetical protein
MKGFIFVLTLLLVSTSFAYDLTGGYLTNRKGEQIRLGCYAYDDYGVCHKAHFLHGKDGKYTAINKDLVILMGKSQEEYQERWYVFNWLKQRASTSLPPFPYTRYIINMQRASRQFLAAFRLMDQVGIESLKLSQKTNNRNFKEMIKAIQNFGEEKVDDADLSSAVELKYFNLSDWFRPTTIKTRKIADGQIGIRFVLKRAKSSHDIQTRNLKLSINGKRVEYTPNSGVQNIAACEAATGATARALLVLDNKHYRIMDRDVYELDFRVKCGEESTLIFDTEKMEGQIMAIHDIAETAIAKFKKAGLLDFWKRRISIKWPGRGDFYQAGTVNVTKGDHWDVVAHELGHAIYDQARLGRFGGGQHYIDRCYTTTLALSEGWASFFSAWLKVDLNHPDAQFEFMVPRRAPLKFENIPADVCAGQTNEWRVTGFFWDLIDLHDDDESSRLSFKDYWNLHFNKRFRETKQFAQLLKDSGHDPILVNLVWEKNFLTQL